MSDKLHFANISRDELALWIFEGLTDQRAPADLSLEDALADIVNLGPAGVAQLHRCRAAADHALGRLMTKFQMTRQ